MDTTIGSEAVARQLIDFPWNVKVEKDWWNGKMSTYFYVDLSILPEGWTLVGSGCSRKAFRGPDGFIYKLDNSFFQTGDLSYMEPDEDGYDYLTTNFEEAYIYERFADVLVDKSKGQCRFARSNYFYDIDVIAMEYVPKVRDVEPSIIDLMRAINFDGDTHSGNFWSDGKHNVMVDYGYVRCMNEI